jgi:hypothetical protein
LVVVIEPYRRGTRARDAAGHWTFWGCVTFPGVIWLSGPRFAPPPGAQAVTIVALALWFERHRQVPVPP